MSGKGNTPQEEESGVGLSQRDGLTLRKAYTTHSVLAKANTTD